MTELRIVHFKVGEIETKRLKNILSLLDKSFIPPISDMIDLDIYTDKLARHAEVCIVQYNNRDVGECAFYMNQRPQAFITSIGILPEVQGKGIADMLLKQVLEIIKKNNFYFVGLQVAKENINARHLYKKNDFKVIDDTRYFFIMRCRLV